MKSFSRNALVALAILSASLLSTAQPAAADTEAALACGYNDDTEIGAVFNNCGPDTVRLLTTDFIGGESTQCVAPFSILRLGPSWFVADSVVIGLC